MIFSIIIIAIVGVVLALVIGLIVLYNKLNKSRNQISNAESSLDALLIQRHDLIPNLISVIKQNVEYEKGVLEKIAELRSQKEETKGEYKQDGELSSSIKNLMVQVESYPALKANDHFMRLNRQWSEVEEQISAGRRYLSASITWYNDEVKTFPSNLVASSFGFQPYAWERATEEQKKEINANDYF